MNAEKQTQVKSPTMQLIDHCQKQNELIFATRKRLFQVEQNNKISFVLIGILTLAVLLLAINDTVIKGLI